MRTTATIAAVGMAAAAALALTSACAADAARRDRVKATLESALSAPDRPRYVTPDAEGRKLWKLTRQFYERRQHQPAWIDGTDPLEQIDELVAALKAASDEGLHPDLYNVALLDARLIEARKGLLTDKGFDVEEAGSLDVWLTYSYMSYASDLADGLSDLAHANERWQIKPEQFDPAAHLEQALESHRVEASMRALTPEHPDYAALRQALHRYRESQAKGGWPRVPATLKVKPGQTNRDVPALAARLAATGDFGGRLPAAGRPAAYSKELEEAVKAFQRRHGLADDGVVGPSVVSVMNVPVEKRIAQIELNLERWRWLPRSLGDRHILVNIPEYRLEVRDRNQVPLAMRVVVGKSDTPTPIFSGRMTYLVFSPYWNVPPDIAEGETLPEVLKDPGFLERSDMEVIDADGRPVDPSAIDPADPTRYRFRQRPGAHNSLGLVKFMFPNEHNVYLHDTPADSLFARASRSFSHGCVRLEEPLALASYVLRDRGEWTRERIEEAMNAGEEKVVKLTAAIPVYLVYWTARASGDGVVQFRNDVYGIDAQQTRQLAERLARLRKSAAAAAVAANAAPQRRPARAGATRSSSD